MIKCQENSDYTLRLYNIYCYAKMSVGRWSQMNCDNINHVFEDAKETYYF